MRPDAADSVRVQPDQTRPDRTRPGQTHPDRTHPDRARPDEVIRHGRSLLQHGPLNDRVYLMKLDESDLPGLPGLSGLPGTTSIIDRMEELAAYHGYTRLFARVPEHAAHRFLARGFAVEARVPGMCRGRTAGCFMGRHLWDARAVPRRPGLLCEVLALANARRAGLEQGTACARHGSQPSDATSGTQEMEPKPKTGRVIELNPDHAPALARLYAATFATYPFPVHDPAYLARSMAEGVLFHGIADGDDLPGNDSGPTRGNDLLAAASAEVDMAWRCAEMTDFATRPEARGRGAALRLLRHMEERVRRMGILTAYTIARAESHAMNVVFARAGYTLAGTLHNNTNIGGGLESMNVWYRHLPE